MIIVRTLGKGQVVIPKAIRDRLKIKAGKRLLLAVKGVEIILKLLPDNPIQALHGILKHKGPSTADLLRMRREERAREERDLT